MQYQYFNILPPKNFPSIEKKSSYIKDQLMKNYISLIFISKAKYDKKENNNGFPFLLFYFMNAPLGSKYMWHIFSKGFSEKRQKDEALGYQKVSKSMKTLLLA